MYNSNLLEKLSWFTSKWIIISFKRKNKDITNINEVKQFILENMYNWPSIYSLINFCNWRIYIWATNFSYKRKKQHFDALKKWKHPNKEMQRDFIKYWESAFIFSIIDSDLEWKCRCKWDKEKEYIQMVDKNVCYNLIR